MEILGGPWAPSGGPGGSSGDLQAMNLTAGGAPGASGRVWERPGRPSGVPWPRAVLRDSRGVLVIQGPT